MARTGYRPDKRSAETLPALPPCAVDDESVDAALIQLLIAAKADQLAARVVLQRMLPGLVTIARRKSYSFAHRVDVLDDLIANAWGIILKYPVERRPRRVLANLLCDTSFETFVRPQRLRSSSEVPVRTTCSKTTARTKSKIHYMSWLMCCSKHEPTAWPRATSISFVG